MTVNLAFELGRTLDSWLSARGQLICLFHEQYQEIVHLCKSSRQWAFQKRPQSRWDHFEQLCQPLESHV